MSRHHPPTPLNLFPAEPLRTSPSAPAFYPTLTPLPTPPLTCLPNVFWSPQFIFPSFSLAFPEPHLLGPDLFPTDFTPAVDYAGLSTIPNATHMSSAIYPACISPQVFQHGRATFTPLTPHDEDFGDLLRVFPSGDATEFNQDDDEKTGEQEQRTSNAATHNLAQGIQSSELHDGEATYLAYNLQQKDLPTPGGSDAFHRNDESWIDKLRAARKKSVPGRRQSLKKSYAKMFPPSTNIGTFNHVQKFLHIIAGGLYSDLIFWSKRGNELVVPDAHRFAKQVLPKYYSTQTLESFVRQCTTYKMERLKFRSTEGTEGYVFSIPGVTEDSRALLGAYRRVPFLPSWQADRHLDLSSFLATESPPQTMEKVYEPSLRSGAIVSRFHEKNDSELSRRQLALGFAGVVIRDC